MADPSLVRLFLVDDHPVVRLGLHRLLEQIDSFSVVGEAESSEVALPQIKELNPDLVLVDISLGGVKDMGGIELTRRLTSECPGVSVLIISMHDDAYHVRKGLEAGAAGFVPKDKVGEVLVDAAKTVLDGQRYLYRGGQTPPASGLQAGA